MSQSYAISHLLNNSSDTKPRWSEDTFNDKRIVTKLPSDIVQHNMDLFPHVYKNMHSQKPEIVYKALSSYSILLLPSSQKLQPPIEIVNMFFEFAKGNRFKEISYEAANNLYVVFLNFPNIREYLLQNKFYTYLFNHLNKAIKISFCDAIKIEPTILIELAKNGAVELVFNSILNWESITKIEEIPRHEIYPPMDPQFIVQPTKENVLISNISVFKQFLKYGIENAISLNNDLTSFLFQFIYVDNSFLYQHNLLEKEIQLAALKYLKASVKYSWEILQGNGFFAYILKNCVNEELFNVVQYCTLLKILENATYFCCDYLIGEGLFSTIHAVFSRNDETEYPEVLGIKICTAVAKNSPDKIAQLISESGPGLPKDFIHYSNAGSYPEKKVYLNFCIELTKLANVAQVSDFLAEVSSIQFFSDFLESSFEPIFIDILKSLLYLINMSKNNAISKNLSDHLNFVIENSSLLKTIEGFMIDDELSSEINDDEFVNNLIDISQLVIDACSEQIKQNE